MTLRCLIANAMLAVVATLTVDEAIYSASVPPKVETRQVEPYVYVIGGVRKPGRYDWIKDMTVLDAVTVAGGFTQSAGRRVRIVHIGGAAESYARGSTNAPPVLRAGDRVAVPERIF